MQADLIITADWIVPIEPENICYEHHALVINNGQIVDILPTETALQTYQASTLEQRIGQVLIPGLINSHTHASMTLMRGIADDRTLHDWLQNHIWPLEQQWVCERFIQDGADLAIAEMIRGGTTCFNDMYFFPDMVAKQAIQAGIRACVGLILIDFPSAWAAHSDEYLQKGLALQNQLQYESLIHTAWAPHAPYTVSDLPLQRIRDYSEEFHIPIHMHVHETAQEVEDHVKQQGCSPLKRLERLGLLSSSFMAVHMTQLSPTEIQHYAQTGGHIVHCPESNLKLASGFHPLAQCLEAGINVALGTDGAASNNDLDLFSEMRTAALLAKGVSGDPCRVPAFKALQMATINGAKALGIDSQTGSLTVGKSADIVAVDLSQPETQPVYDPISHLVYCAGRHQVTDVWVAGRALLKNRQLTTLDWNSIQERVKHWQLKLQTIR